ncbi:MAG TPA: hypothetical protein PK459_03410 [Anaerolineaceae bacterium]|nr:hypothetical protein [Anaerolineaceae bacterium]
METESESPRLYRKDVSVKLCSNLEADNVFLKNYWLKRKRHSRRLSYRIHWQKQAVGWVQVADPFGTQLTPALQEYSVSEAIELCRGFFLEEAPLNIESCGIAMVLRDVPNTWFINFGEIKRIAIVYQDLDFGQKGIVYKALGFSQFGRTVKGRNYLYPSRGDIRGEKVIWAKVLRPISGEHYKNILPNPINIG